MYAVAKHSIVNIVVRKSEAGDVERLEFLNLLITIHFSESLTHKS